MKIEFPTIFENDRVILSRLGLSDAKYLEEVAFEDPTLLRYSPSEIHTKQKLHAYLKAALIGYKNKVRFPYTIYDKAKSVYAGSTSFGNFYSDHKRVEIGWTWIGRKHQGTDLNRNIKYLMLSHAFDHMRLNRVEFRIDERNIVSRKAVEKIGGKLEGILRKHTIMSDGFIRNTCYYSIIKESWMDIKEKVFGDLIPQNEMKS